MGNAFRTQEAPQDQDFDELNGAYALVVGGRSTSSRRRSRELFACYDDSDMVVQTLLEAGICDLHRLVHLQSASHEELRNEFERMASRTRFKSNLVVFYFAGPCYEEYGRITLGFRTCHNPEDRLTLQYFRERLSDDIVLVSFLGNCRSYEGIDEHETANIANGAYSPSMLFPAEFAWGVLRSTEFPARKTTSFTLVGREKQFFSKSLVKYLGARGLDLHELANRVAADSHGKCAAEGRPRIISNLSGDLCLRPLDPPMFPKIDARGLLEGNSFVELVQLAREVTALTEPTCVRWDHYCKDLCELPRLLHLIKCADAFGIAEAIWRSNQLINDIPAEDTRSYCIPALLLLLRRFEAEAQLAISLASDPTASSLCSQEYNNCVTAMLALQSSHLVDEGLAAWVSTSMRYHHQMMLSSAMARRNVDECWTHFVQTKLWTCYAADAFRQLNLLDVMVASFVDCNLNTLEKRIASNSELPMVEPPALRMVASRSACENGLPPEGSW